MQLKLNLWSKANPPGLRWEELEGNVRAEVVERLARLIAKAIIANAQVEENVDDIPRKD